jgi:hypothetical protein
MEERGRKLTGPGVSSAFVELTDAEDEAKFTLVDGVVDFPLLEADGTGVDVESFGVLPFVSLTRS